MSVMVSNLSRRLWHILSSVRLALVLMIIIGAFGVVGALLVQMPPEVAADSAARAAWVEEVGVSRVGAWAPLLSALGLFDVFHSVWFLGAGALLVANILVCSLGQRRRLRAASRGGPVEHEEAFFLAAQNNFDLAGIALAPAEVGEKAAGVLQARGYRVRTSKSGASLNLAGDRNRYSPWGTYLVHLSLVLFIAGFIVGSYLGFRDTSFVVPEGAVREVGHGTGLSLRLEAFTAEYWPDGSPEDFRSDVVVFDEGAEVMAGTVRVNHPLSYGGTRFHQSFFGPAFSVEVRDSGGAVLYGDVIALSIPIEGDGLTGYAGGFDLPTRNLQVYVVSGAGGSMAPMLGEQEALFDLYDATTLTRVGTVTVGVGQSAEAQGLEFALLGQGEYSGFQVSRDPGNPLIWIASVLFLVGLAVVLYFPHREVWGLVRPEAGGESRLLLRSTSTKGPGAADVGRLGRDIEAAFGEKNPRQ